MGEKDIFYMIAAAALLTMLMLFAVLLIHAAIADAQPVVYPADQPAWYNQSLPAGKTLVRLNVSTTPHVEYVLVNDSFQVVDTDSAGSTSASFAIDSNVYCVNFTANLASYSGDASTGYYVAVFTKDSSDNIIWELYLAYETSTDFAVKNGSTVMLSSLATLGVNVTVHVCWDTASGTWNVSAESPAGAVSYTNLQFTNAGEPVTIYFYGSYYSTSSTNYYNLLYGKNVTWTVIEEEVDTAHALMFNDSLIEAFVRAPAGTVFTSTNASQVWVDEAYINAPGNYSFEWAEAAELRLYNGSAKYLGNATVEAAGENYTVDVNGSLVYLPAGENYRVYAADYSTNIVYLPPGASSLDLALVPPGQPLYTITIVDYQDTSAQLLARLLDRYGHTLWLGNTSASQPIYAHLPYLQPFTVAVTQGGVERVVANLVADQQLSKTVYLGFSYTPTYIGRLYLHAQLLNSTTLRLELTAPYNVTATVTVYKYNGSSRVPVATVYFSEPAEEHVATVYLPGGDPFFEAQADVSTPTGTATLRAYTGSSLPPATAPPEALSLKKAAEMLMRDLPADLYAVGPARIAVWALGLVTLLVFAAASITGLGFIAAALAMVAANLFLGGSLLPDLPIVSTLIVAGAVLLYTKREKQ